VKTPLVDQQIADQAKAHGISPERVVREVMLVHQAREEFVRVEELAALVVFLGSDDAASITAAAIAMDNGWTQH
jgi:3-hydroxybutyrate dehydrogenase